jgi:hypothetical protein
MGSTGSRLARQARRLIKLSGEPAPINIRYASRLFGCVPGERTLLWLALDVINLYSRCGA